MLEFLPNTEYLSLINLQTLSNFAVVGAFIFTILTFYLTNKDNKRSEQLKRVQEIQKMLSRENQNMMQNLYFTKQNPLQLNSSEHLTSSSHEFIRYLYQPVVDVAEWASFLLLNNDIEKDYERHLINQIREVYSFTENMFPELLENDEYDNLKKINTRWKNKQRK
ncbi:hypothetical protein [Candidatus Nitrosocosmicus hydrocola]|uniref:hypothetical protein n=1 Tax=Candidatus Nitrosocosmicus hydrocola TaxID=1826872 RepID=UPI0011E5EAAA|nr:hypothetical protein [Candidatus Nitrosocosmicus hydrocola]